MKEYKILKPQKTNAKRIFVPKGHAVPEDILDDITVNPETSTLWEEKCGDDIINSDQIPTHFTGKWNYEISELSNIQGHISLEPIYTYDYICELITIRGGLPEYDSQTGAPINYKPVPLEKIQDKQLYSIISALVGADDFDNYYYPVKISEITVNSDTVLSDMNFDFAGEYFSDSYWAQASINDYKNNCIYFPGNYKYAAELYESKIESLESYEFDLGTVQYELVNGRSLTVAEQFDIELNDFPTHRMAIIPKYQKFYELFLNVDIPENGYITYNYFANYMGDYYGDSSHFYSPHITVMDGDKPFYKTLTLLDGNAIGFDVFKMFERGTKFAMYATGDSLSSLTVYGTGTQMMIDGVETSISELLETNIKHNISAKFITDPVGQSVNFYKIIVDNISLDEAYNAGDPNTLDIDISNPEYIGTVIYENSPDDVDGPGLKSAIHNAFNVPYEDIKFTNAPQFKDYIENSVYGEDNRAKFDVDGYTCYYVVNLDNPSVGIEMYYSAGLYTEAFPEGIITNVGLIYFKQ